MTHSVKDIIHLNSLDTVGGAASVSSTLHRYFKQEGFHSRRFVGIKLGDDPDTFELSSELKSSVKTLPLHERLARLCHIAGPVLRRRLEILAELEDLGHPFHRYILDLLPCQDEIILCHNLHGGYFDLNLLPEISRRHPVVLLLHDTWLLGGHCAHSFDCDKWINGCGHCPYLNLQYSLKRDTSRLNWLRKKRILESCHLNVVTPSQWLMGRVERSILKPSVLKSRVINNGVDQIIFSPADKKHMRACLGLKPDDRVVMFAANGIRESVWKDYATMRAAVADAARTLRGKPLRFLAVGENAPEERIGEAVISFVPYQDAADLARYYCAADVYIHAARAENFPNTVIEALSCGTPVVATAVGGIPEQVKGLRHEGDSSGLNKFGIEEATGILTPVGDAQALSHAVRHLFNAPEVLDALSVLAASDAAARFSIKRTGAQYLDFFETVLGDWHRRQTRLT